MVTVVIVYQLNSSNYPVLSTKTDAQIEYWIRQGALTLGSVYDKLPSNEVFLDAPVTVVVTKP